tara:strand:- start:116 stop:511 length:396 start_codon:yes stop_codon:yes gene_type:complete
MENVFKIEIISPEKIIFSESATIVKFPSYEGDMSILKDHISIIAFLRPGIIKVDINEKSVEKFFVEDGTVEYFNNNLVILSASVINVKDLSKDFLESSTKNALELLSGKDISDHTRYILNYKIEALKEIRT